MMLGYFMMREFEISRYVSVYFSYHSAYLQFNFLSMFFMVLIFEQEIWSLCANCSQRKNILGLCVFRDCEIFLGHSWNFQTGASCLDV